jgi:anti-sigma factor RsiW
MPIDQKRHYGEGEWCDYVRGLTAAEARAEMEAHLVAGCARCEELRWMAAELTSFAEAEAGLEVPDALVARAAGLGKKFSR